MIAIVGGGIVGLAVAWALRDLHPVVFEKERAVALHQSGRNSGIIHSGVYYRPGTVKARLCVEGGRRLVDFCRRTGVRVDVCGKLILSTNRTEIDRLAELERRGKANGVAVERIGPGEVRRFEPNARPGEALWIPSAGIVDYGGVVRKMAESVEVRTGVHVRSVRELGAKLVITCAGLYSDRIARSRLKIAPFRGEYYGVRRGDLIRNMIYPVPVPDFPFLGVHFHRTIDGGLEAGPNAVLALSREGYRWRDVNVRDLLDTLGYPGFWRMARRYWRTGLEEIRRSCSRRVFLRDLQKLVPSAREEDLVPGRTGVRAQALDLDGVLVDDFRVEVRPGEIHVLNAPSPAATSSLAIGEHVAALARRVINQPG